MRFLIRFLADDDAATAVEYAVMLALILLACLVAIQAVGTAQHDLELELHQAQECRTGGTGH